MKSINLDETMQDLAKSNSIYATISLNKDGSPTVEAGYTCATKRDILRSCIPILREMFLEKSGLTYKRSDIEDVLFTIDFLDYCEALVNEKAVIKDLEKEE